ncbi:hypothetical protein P8452_61437 [Trifolium repens]|nr:hypothetical protein P8452_61437 [Trifolium repens]
MLNMTLVSSPIYRRLTSNLRRSWSEESLEENLPGERDPMSDFPDSGIYRCSHGAATRSSAQTKRESYRRRSGSCSANALAKRRKCRHR